MAARKADGHSARQKVAEGLTARFIHWATRRKIHRPSRSVGRKVLFFVDQYVNWHNPVLGRSLVEVLRTKRSKCFVPSTQVPSYMAMIASGDVQRARGLIKSNIQCWLTPFVRGYHIITSEPSAALCLTREYRQLIDNEDTRLIAENNIGVLFVPLADALVERTRARLRR